MSTPSAFADLALRPELLSALSRLGYEEATPIQREAIPPLLQGRDVLGQAATGTGKTAAFALPLLQRLATGPRGRGPLALVLAPTRELAMQVSEAVHNYGRELGARVLPVYGGQPIGRQLRTLEAGVDVVVATPGRAVDHLTRGSLRLSETEVVVLDEADEMLDMGFAEDLETILKAAPAHRQTVLFSATMPPRLEGLVRHHLTDPVRVRIEREAQAPGQAPRVRQTAYVVARPYKAAALGRVLDVEQPTAAIVFCRTREEVDALTETLNGRGYRAEALHGGMSQEQRDRVMGRLRGGTAELLVATDVAARGLDLDLLTHVVNYNVPSSPEAYVHRIGRVGRAGREGVALTLAEPRERRMLTSVERVTGQRIAVEKVPTVDDVRGRRLDTTRAALREALLDEALPDDELNPFRAVVDALAGEFGLAEVASAAVKLLHEQLGGPLDEQDIPEPAPAAPRSGTAARSVTAPRSGTAARGGSATGGAPGSRSAPGPRGERAQNAPAQPPARDSAGSRGAPGIPMTKVFVGAGRGSGMRPQDLVGAIAGESSLSGRDIGAIEIHERFALVEVPEAAVDEVVAALRATIIRGGKPTVRREGAQRR